MSEQFQSAFVTDPVFYDEMLTPDGAIRETYDTLSQWLQKHPLSALRDLNEQATRHFYDKGITFTVYSDASNTERVIPFDIIPRIIAQKEWSILEAGCKQRVKALNAFLSDIYSGGEILKAGIIPAAQVLANECFQPSMMGIDLPGNIYASISGIDIVRDGQGQYCVLEDNLRTPSGVSYLLEARQVSKQLLPEVFHDAAIQDVTQYPGLLSRTLSNLTSASTPQIVVLTPGRFNSAYYEHAFLAREMDVPLVEGKDLFVDGLKVYLKTVEGPVQVDVIYRRLDDPFIDPLTFRPDSMLGVPGLMAAYRSGNVILANAPGTGVADDKSIYPYVGDMINFYLGEKPILHNVPTWQCRKPDDLAYVLNNMQDLVIKETQGSGGYGMLIGPKATRAQIEKFKTLLTNSPEGYIAQPTLALSVCPTLVEEGVAPRHIDLRPFVLSSVKGTEVLPGGLTRVALTKGSLVVNSSQGGGTKDTWIMDI